MSPFSQNAAHALKVLIVDDETSVLNALRRTLRKEVFDLTLTSSSEEALNYLSEESFAVVLSDQRMPQMEGTRLLEKARHISPHTVRMLLTGYVNTQAAVEAINRGAVSRFIAKPWDDEDLRLAIRQGVAQYELVMENRRLQMLTERQNTSLKALNQDLAMARKQEMDIAANIQKMLLFGAVPRDFSGLNVAALTLPSREVDGDFYDFIEQTDRCLDVIVGDVMGKGVPAALLSAATKSQFLRSMGKLSFDTKTSTRPDPGEIVRRVHAEITGQLIDLESFVTAFYARIDMEENRLSFVDCGHTRTVHYRDCDGFCTLLPGKHMPLGFSKAEIYEQASVPFDKGDLFCFYSDGLTEARNGAGDLFGERRLLQAIEAGIGCTPEEIINKILESIVAFCGSDAFADDLTCVIAQIADGSGGKRQYANHRA